MDGEKLEEKNDNWKNQVGMVLAEANFHETMNAVQIGRIMENIFSQWDAGLYETYLNDFKLEHKKADQRLLQRNENEAADRSSALSQSQDPYI